MQDQKRCSLLDHTDDILRTGAKLKKFLNDGQQNSKESKIKNNLISILDNILEMIKTYDKTLLTELVTQRFGKRNGMQDEVRPKERVEAKDKITEEVPSSEIDSSDQGPRYSL